MSDHQYDPELAPLIPMLPSLSDLATLESIHEVRKNMTALRPPADPRDDVVVEDRRVPGPEGAPEVMVRVYKPREAGDEPLPGVFEIHGGGFLMGSVDMMDPWCELVAAQMKAVVVSVEYRLAPEHPYPAGVEDCHAALSWMASRADALGLDASRIAIAGQSAGGGLAAATALLCRDRGGPSLCFQLLEIPELDDRLETPSMRGFEDTPLWNRPNAIWSWRHYLGPELEAGSADVPIYAAPARAEDLSGLPPAYVSVMEFDPLRDEGIAYATRLLQAGVSTELHAFPGTFHGSALIGGARVSQRGVAETSEVLARALGRAPA